MIQFVLYWSLWLHLENRLKGSREEMETNEEAMSSRSETWLSGLVAIVRQNERRIQCRRKKEMGRDRERNNKTLRHGRKHEPKTQGELQAVEGRHRISPGSQPQTLTHGGWTRIGVGPSSGPQQVYSDHKICVPGLSPGPPRLGPGMQGAL